MKQYIITLLVVLGSLTMNAQEVVWHQDINKAIEISMREKKPMLLFFTGSDWCGWCIKLQNEVFKKPEFITWASEVVLVELDFPRRTKQDPAVQQQNAQIQQIFQVQGYPTIWFVKPEKNGEQINLQQLGKTGYIAGGPQTWLTTANQILGK
jgi:thioredoxin-related protein